MKMKKVFVGIRVPRDTTKQLQRYLESISDLPLRFTKPENFHVSIISLGFYPEESVAFIAESIQDAIFPLDPFDILLDRIELLPGKKRGSGDVLAHVGHESAEALALYNRIRNALGISSAPAHKFSPHIVLAHTRRTLWDVLPEKSHLTILKKSIIPVSEVTLFESVFSAGHGLQYETVAECSLSGMET